MPLDVRHSRVSAVPDNGDPDLVQGTDWNAAHALQQGPSALLGRADSAAGQAATVEVPLSAFPPFTATGIITIAIAGLPINTSSLVIHPTDAAQPSLELFNNGGAANQKRSRLAHTSDGAARWMTLNDAGAPVHVVLLRADGSVLIESGVSSGNFQVNGQFVGQADVIGLALWSISTGATPPVIWMQAQGNPTDKKLWKTVEDNLGLLHIQALNDATNIVQGEMIVTRDGTIQGAVGGMPQNIKNNVGSYTLLLSDAGKHIYHALSSATVTYAIPVNAAVAFPIGTEVKFINDAASTVTISCGDTLSWSPTGATGPRTLAQFGIASAIKVTATRWLISGFGLT